jgi:thiol-disulfide isomerase/thioredoxin
MKKILALLLCALLNMLQVSGQKATNPGLPEDHSNETETSTDLFIKKMIHKPIKAFKLTDLDNQTWQSGKLKGKIIVINFWFTACKPCITEIPHLNKLVEAYKNNPVVFLAPAPETAVQLKKFLGKYSFRYNIIPSSLDYITATGVENFPTHLVVNPQGIIQKVFIGYDADITEKLQAEINKWIH